MLFSKNKDAIKKKDAIDIIISLDSFDTIPKTATTFFDINNESVEGPLERIENMIVEFFRRRGIRFYGK